MKVNGWSLGTGVACFINGVLILMDPANDFMIFAGILLELLGFINFGLAFQEVSS